MINRLALEDNRSQAEIVAALRAMVDPVNTSWAPNRRSLTDVLVHQAGHHGPAWHRPPDAPGGRRRSSGTFVAHDLSDAAAKRLRVSGWSPPTPTSPRATATC